MSRNLLLVIAIVFSLAFGLYAQDVDDLLGGDDAAEKADGDVEEAAEEVADDAEGAEEAVVEEVEEVAREAVDEVKKFPCGCIGKCICETEKEGKSILHRLAMWLPNRLVDIDDIFSSSIGVGAESGMQVRLTRYCQYGGSYGSKYYFTKGYSRQYGGAYMNGYNIQDTCWIYENRYVEDCMGTVRPYIIKQDKFTVPTYSQEVYREDIRDLWEIGVGGGWLIYVDFYVHPVEIADFVTGIFLVDIRGDDF